MEKNRQGFSPNQDQKPMIFSKAENLKIEAEPCSARFLFLAALPPKTASACRKTDQREVFLQAANFTLQKSLFMI